MKKTPKELIDERATIQKGFFKGSHIPFTEKAVEQLMEDYHKQFEQSDVIQAKYDIRAEELDAIIEKQAELIAHLRYQPQSANSNNAYILYWKKAEQLESELQSLQEGKEKEETITDKPYSKGEVIHGEGDIDYYRDEDGSVSYA